MFKYNIIFCINGRILVQSNTTGEYFKYDYNNLNNFLCVCSLNNGNIPTTDEEYKNAQNKIITSFVDENDYFTEEAKELIKKDTEGKKAAIDSFYSLNQSEIMYLKDAFDYFCPENELEERLEELEFEIDTSATIIETLDSQVKDNNIQHEEDEDNDLMVKEVNKERKVGKRTATKDVVSAAKNSAKKKKTK